MLVLTIIYITICVVVAAFVVWNMFTSKKIWDKVTGIIALAVLILRIFLIK